MHSPERFTAFGIANYPSSQINENQRETYKFGVLALQKSTTDVDLQLAYFMRTSAVSFTPDRIGDLMYNGLATDVYRGSIVNGIQGDSAFHLNDAHTLRAGLYVSAEKTTVARRIAAAALRRDHGRANPARYPVSRDRYQRAPRLAGRRLSAGRMEAHG